MNKHIKNSYLLSLAIALTVGSLNLTGCAGFGKRGDRADRKATPLRSLMGEDEPEFVTPRSMMAIWKPSTYEKPGTKSLRGFGGRFYFHDASNEPVKVEGSLTIYGYDDASGDAATADKADRKFVFETSTLQKHYSSSGIGPSYSFWVPWDEVGGVERTITLIPVFKSASGEIPESTPSTLRLPGKKREVVASPQESLYGPGTQVISASGVVSDKPMVQHAGGALENDSLANAKPKVAKTTTLRLPRHLAQRLAQTSPTAKPAVANKNPNTSAESHDESGQEINTVEDIRTKPTATDADRRGSRPVFGQPGSF